MAVETKKLRWLIAIRLVVITSVAVVHVLRVLSPGGGLGTSPGEGVELASAYEGFLYAITGVTYALCLRLFGVYAGAPELLGYLPVIFFGAATPGPMHSVAIVLWVILFPDKLGEMTAFAFVQHNFFILFNAAIGLLFLRRATRELFGAPA